MPTRLLLAAVLLIAPILRPEARAQTRPGYALDRFTPAARGSHWFVLDSLDLRGNGRLAVGLTPAWSYLPLARERDSATALVAHQFFAHLGIDTVIANRLRIGFNLPLGLFAAGRDVVQANDLDPPTRAFALGDVRLSADVRLFGRHGDAITGAVGAQFYGPLGSRRTFSGDGTIRLAGRFALAGQRNRFTYAVQLGVQYRPLTEPFLGRPLGSEAFFALAAGVRLLDGRLVFGPEVYFSSLIERRDLFFSRAATPVELLIGAHYQLNHNLRVGLGVGTGLTRADGAPVLRITGALEWVAPATAPATRTARTTPPPPAPPPDRDSDGIADRDDACPTQAGPRSSDPARTGCPPPPDRDSDGIADAEDACPETAGVRTTDPHQHGCPPPTDVFVVMPGPTGKVGAIQVDDGHEVHVLDQAWLAVQRDQQGRMTPTRMKQEQIHRLFGAALGAQPPRPRHFLLYFDRGHDSPGGAEATLAEIVAESRRPAATVDVIGHTDRKGDHDRNIQLSLRRANRVRDLLVRRGVPADRITTVGRGEIDPLVATADDVDARRNRRVEVIVR